MRQSLDLPPTEPVFSPRARHAPGSKAAYSGYQDTNRASTPTWTSTLH